MLISADEEVQAVKLLHDAIQDLPMDYSLLECQAAFCKSKGRPELALECAKRSVIAAPSEFCTWARLAETYVSMEQWDLALLTLNSCPMFTSQDKDAPQMPEPSRVVLPILADCMLDEIDEGPSANDIEMIHPSLRKLHAASYKGTFHKAYSLLTEITAKIGWDQLLRIRSQVFVMEEEYRSEKQTSGNQGGVASGNASTTALRSTPSPSVNGNGPKPNGDTDDGDQSSKISSTTAPETEPNGPTNGTSKVPEESIEKPENTVASEIVKAGSEEVSSHSPGSPVILERFTEVRLAGPIARPLYPVPKQASLRAVARQPLHGPVRRPAHLHDLADRRGGMQATSPRLQEIGRGMGDSRRPGGKTASSRRSRRGVPGMLEDSILAESDEGRAQDARKRGAIQGCARSADTVDCLAVSVVF